MTVLNELLERVKKSDLDDQLKQICDQIMIEERPKFNNPDLEPKSPNIFLSIQYLDSPDVRYLTLEREMKEKYIIGSWESSRKDTNLKRKRVWEVTGSNADFAEKILKYFAETLKFVKGN